MSIKIIESGIVLGAIAFTALHAAAGISNDIRVEINGDVWGNQISSGGLGTINPGDSITYSFELDSASFVDGGFPVRGYLIDTSTFQITSSSGAVVLAANPYPAGLTPMFVVRNDDPAADGFFLTDGSVDGFPGAIQTEQAGIFGNFGARFNVSYTGDTLSSLDILGAVGSYDFDGLTVFGMGINDGPFKDVLGADFSSMTISVIPVPATMLGLSPIAAMGLTRRRR